TVCTSFIFLLLYFCIYFGPKDKNVGIIFTSPTLTRDRVNANPQTSHNFHFFQLSRFRSSNGQQNLDHDLLDSMAMDKINENAFPASPPVGTNRTTALSFILKWKVLPPLSTIAD
ncbi:hypothetical protein IscW_ISCW004117, partial [Ixodes scapularis]